MADSSKVIVGQNLKRQIEKFERKTKRKVKISEIACAVGVSCDCVRKILNGKRTGSPSTLIALANYFKCSTDDLIMPKNKTMSK